MNSNNSYLKIMLLVIGCCLFSTGVYAAEEAMEDTTMTDDEAMAEDDGMLEEEVEELPPLYTSSVEIGGGWSSENDFKFGEYNGHEDRGGFAIGNITLKKNAIIGDADNTYWKFTGTHLGLDNRNIFMEYSKDGTYGDYNKNSAYSFFFEYDQIPHNQFNDGQTPFNGAGTTLQSLPANWVTNTGNNGTSTLTNLLSSLKTVELETERQRFGGGFKWHPINNWLVQGKYRHEIKEGSDPMGAVFGSSGGNPKASVIAIPINYDVDEFNISLAFVGKKAQYSLDYSLSLFDNNDTSVLFQNPFSRTNQWIAAANYPAFGQLGLFPDNQAHKINLQGGYNFSPKTRATGTFSYSRWLQDQTFLPYSNVGTVTTPLPRNSLDGDIETVFANLNLFHRLTNKINLKARYTYENKNNNTPRDTYIRIAGDAENQPAITTDNARRNWTYDLERHKLELDGNYRITMRTNMSVGYDFEKKDRNFSEVDTTHEHTGRIKLSSSFLDNVTAWVKYARSLREYQGDYISNQPVLTGHDPAFLATQTAAQLYENDPLMRKYHFADRDRDSINAAVNYNPLDKLAFTLSGLYRNDDFDKTQIGLQKAENAMLTLDVNYQPTDTLNSYAYISKEIYSYNQRGYRRDATNDVGPGFDRNNPGNNCNPGGITPCAYDFWTTDTDDTINTFGAGIDWNVVEDKFDLKLDFTYSKAYTDYDQWSGPRLTGGNVAAPLPKVTTRIMNLSLTGEYKVKNNLTAKFKYMYDRYRTDDFTLDRVGVNTLENVILLGQSSPNYVGHTVGVSFIYEF